MTCSCLQSIEATARVSVTKRSSDWFANHLPVARFATCTTSSAFTRAPATSSATVAIAGTAEA